MNHAEHCRFQAERSLAEAETTTLGNVRDRYLRAATAWQQMADRAERVAIDREAREKARTEIPHAGSDDHGHVDRVPLRSEEHTSELQSLMRISYAVFCLKKKKKQTTHPRLQM